jgi:hypothetical protein
VDKTLGGVIQVRRELNINAFTNLVDAGFQITGNNNGDDLTMAANAQLTIGTALSNTLFPTNYTNANIALDVNSLVVYNSDIDQDISGTPTYGNLQLSSGSAVVKTLTGNTDVDGNLIIDAQNTLTTSGSSFNINAAGDWTNNGSFSANLGDVTFDGTSLSTISGGTSTSFYNLIINNSAADSAVEVNVQTNVTNHLTLTNGVVSTDAGNELVIFDNATASSGSDNSHVDGPLQKVGDDPFIFPVGNGGKWARIGISDLQNGPTATDVFTAEYIYDLNPNAFWDSLDYAGDNDDLHNTSVVEYWNLERNAGAAQPKVSLYWSDNAESYITDTAELVVAHYIGGNTWVNEGGSAFGTLPSGYVTTIGNINTFSPFTFGSVSGGLTNPLPVTLLTFEAELKKQEEIVALKWVTASEINNALFEVERSTDAIHFSKIAERQGGGTTSERRSYTAYDLKPFSGNNYYRLKQYDFNGNVSYSEIIAVFNPNTTEIVVFPNPSSDYRRRVRYENREAVTKVQLFNSAGSPVEFKQLTSEGSLELELSADLPPGVYILQVHFGETVSTQRIVQL